MTPPPEPRRARDRAPPDQSDATEERSRPVEQGSVHGSVQRPGARSHLSSPSPTVPPFERQIAGIPFQDLKRHHAPLAASLETAFRRVLNSGRYVAAPDGDGEVAAFERECAPVLEAAEAIGMSSGTDALLALLMAAGVAPGDGVITTPFSFVASADVIVRLGARPIFVDVDPRTLNLSAAAVDAAASGSRTKAVAILAVHLFGLPCDGAALRSVAARHGLAVFEDAAQAIAARDTDGRPVGTIGRAAALSFFPSKNLGALGDAGMVITGDSQLAAALRRLRTHGATRRFHHQVIGGNFRLDELHAALLRVKLPWLVRWNRMRRVLAFRYLEKLAGLPLVLPVPAPHSAWNQFVVRVADGQRDHLAAFLAKNEIATAIYYPQPLHLQPCFAFLGHRPGEFPVAERACQEVLALPIYPELSPAQVDRVAHVIAAFFGSRPAPTI